MQVENQKHRSNKKIRTVIKTLVVEYNYVLLLFSESLLKSLSDSLSQVR